MMNCLVPLTVAPLILVASTVGPLAQPQSCPVFSNSPDHYDCTTYGPSGQPRSEAVYPLKLKTGTVDGAPSYVMEWPGAAKTVVVGKPLRKDANTVITSNCALVESMKTKQMFPTLIMRTQTAAGALVSETHVREENKSVTLLTFGTQGPNGGLGGRSVCRPKYATPTPPPARPVAPAIPR